MNAKKSKLIRKRARAEVRNQVDGKDEAVYMQQKVKNQHNFRNIKLRPECAKAKAKVMKDDYLVSIRE